MQKFCSQTVPMCFSFSFLVYAEGHLEAIFLVNMSIILIVVIIG